MGAGGSSFSPPGRRSIWAELQLNNRNYNMSVNNNDGLVKSASFFDEAQRKPVIMNNSITSQVLHKSDPGKKSFSSFFGLKKITALQRQPHLQHNGALHSGQKKREKVQSTFVRFTSKVLPGKIENERKIDEGMLMAPRHYHTPIPPPRSADMPRQVLQNRSTNIPTPISNNRESYQPVPTNEPSVVRVQTMLVKPSHQHDGHAHTNHNHLTAPPASAPRKRSPAVSRRRTVIQASTGDLLRCLTAAVFEKCPHLNCMEANLPIVWLRQVDRALLLQGWQDVCFVNPANVVFIYLLVREVLQTEKPETELELRAIILTCLYLSYSYMGNEISYPLKPFLVETNNRARFWERCVNLMNAHSSKMLRLNADASFFAEVFTELVRFGRDIREKTVDVPTTES